MSKAQMLKSAKVARAYCWADGLIEFAKVGHRLPRGVIAFAAGDEADIAARVDAAAVHSRGGKFRLVPGVVDAMDDDAAVDALVSWQSKHFSDFIPAARKGGAE